MCNIILWLHQSTVDYSFRVREPGVLCGNILEAFKKGSDFQSSQFKTTVCEELNKLVAHGLTKDSRIDLIPNEAEDDSIVKDLESLRHFLFEKITEINEKSIQIGGNPAISAMRGYVLRGGRSDDQTDLPISIYAGLAPDTVWNYLNEQIAEDHKLPVFRRKHIQKAFRVLYPIKKSPQTISLEGTDHKLMIVYGPGRKLADIHGAGLDGIPQFVEKICDEIPEGNVTRIVVAITPPYDEEELEYLLQLLELIRKELGDRLVIFVGTNKLKKASFVKMLSEKLLSQADIISMNRDEAEFLHTINNCGGRDDINKPLAQKVRELPFKAIKICHSSHGAIMDLGCMPEHILTSKKFNDNPPDFLEESLTLAVDGATYAVATNAELGRGATEAMIRVYSKHVQNRETELFQSSFLYTPSTAEPMPPGMIWVASALLQRQGASITGAGAIFDSLFLSFLMRG